MQNKVLNGISEIYIDDVLIHGKTHPEFLTNTWFPEKRNWVLKYRI
jgi:hypothetical protein